MVELESVVIVTTAPILGQLFKGGAQRVLYDTYMALQSISRDCTVLQYPCEERNLAQDYLATSITDGSAIRSEHVSRHAAVTLLREADLTLSVDKLLYELPRGRWHVLSLSNLAYDTERFAARQKRWDRLWVPSRFLRDLLIRDYSVPLEKIDVIPPTLDFRFKRKHEAVMTLERDFKRDGIPLRRRLLFPHRSDPAKGIRSAIGLVRRLAKDDHRWRLIVTSPSAFDDPANRSFFERVLRTTTDVREQLIVIPWLPHDTMGELYALSGCTIMASTLPESFGLTAAESISCGTPVVAVEAGALSEQHSELRAVHFVDEIDSSTGAAVVRNICGTRVSQETTSFLRFRFSMEAHIEAVHRAVALLEEDV